MIYTENSSMIKYELNIDDVCQLYEMAKIIKANLIVYSKTKKLMFGFNKSFFDDNVLKTFDPLNNTIYESISDDIPNFAMYTKDLNALLKLNEDTGKPIKIERTNYIGDDNDVLTDIKCGTEHKEVFNYFRYLKKYESIMENKNIQKIDYISDIRKIKEFQEALDHKASEGIIRFKYNNFIYFIFPSMLNALKSDTVSLELYQDTKHNTALLKYIIRKKKYGFVNVIYRTRILE